MKKTLVLLLSLGTGLVSHQSHADLSGVFELASLGKDLFSARKSQVEEARNRNMTASFFSSGTDQCIEPVGSVNVVDPEQAYWVSNLPSPTRILNKVIDDSKCFTVVDRGVGFNALQRERELASAGGLTNSDSIVQAKIRGADYILVPGIVIENADAGSSNFNLAGGAGDLVGNSGKGSLSYGNQKKKAEVMLTLMDVRSSEQVISVTGEAKVSDTQYSFLLLGKTPQAQGSAGIGSRENTAMDEVLRDAYKDAYKRMIAEIGNKNLISRLDKESGEVSGKLQKQEKASFFKHFENEQVKKAERSGKFFGKKEKQEDTQSFTLIRVAPLYEKANLESSVVTELKKGFNVYSLGEEKNNMLKVQNELGHQGWISKIHLQQK